MPDRSIGETKSRALRIVAFGDSTTAPRVVDGKALTVYADRLAHAAYADKPAKNDKLTERDVEVINAGIPGNTTRDARARFEQDVLGRQPDIVIIQFGINDSTVNVWKNPPATKPSVSRDDFAANLSYFVAELRSRGVRVILMTPNLMRWTKELRSLYGKPPYAPDDPDGFNVLLKTYAQAVREVAKQTEIPLMDVYALFQSYGAEKDHSIDDLLLDGMHPNENGHRLIADMLLQQLGSMQLDTPSSIPAIRLKPASSGMELDVRLTDMPALKMGPFVRLGDGRLLTIEDTNCLTSADGAKTWQTHRMFEDPLKFKISDERAIIRTSKGVVIAAFMNNAEEHWTWDNKLHDAPGAVLPTCVMRSTDDGATWEAPQKLHDDWTGAIRDILETKHGRVVFTSMKMRHNPGRHTVLTYSSDDQGQTWKPSNIIDLGGVGHHGGVCEATIIELKDGRLLMLLRTNWMRFWRAESTDGGLTWHPLGPSDIPASSAPGMLRRLQSGRIVLVWNRLFPEGKDTFPLSGGDRIWSETPVSNHRGELSMAFSDDECRTWSKPVVIARRPGTWLVSYPYLFEASPGELWVTTMQGNLRAMLHERDFAN
ncbi:MAG: exo-alpha-sialidase [Verrucomicrobia bacterium]|nr:exo-alpha-sialidase [Verrucomicrobiota bacterium]